MGWLNFHGKLVREVKRADDKEVRKCIVLAPGACVNAACDTVLPMVSDFESLHPSGVSQIRPFVPVTA